MIPITRTTLIVALAAPIPAQEPSPGELTLRPMPFEVRTAEGLVLEVQVGALPVPENREDPDGNTITLAFARLVSTAEEPGPPLIYLHGGPGSSAAGAVRDPRAMGLWAPFLALGDVILLDQRGCGRSQPALARPLPFPPPPEVFASREAYGAFLAEAGRAVAAELAAEGVDVTGYTTEQNADDVDDLRAALGAEKVRLLGFSYGTHLGLSIIRRHGERVESAVLIGVEGPDETQKLPSTYTTQIGKIAALVARDAAVRDDVPDFEALLERVLAKLEREPMVVEVSQPITGERVQVRVGPDALRMILVRDIGDTSDLPVFPRLLYTIDRGDPSVLTWFVQKRYGMGIYPTLAFTMDPASGCSPERSARIAAEAKTCPLGNAMNFVFPAVEAVWRMPVLGDDFRAPLVSDVRTLFLSGDLDANTPPYQAERMRWGFTNSVHLIQGNGGHETWMRNPEVPGVLLAFFAGEDVSGIVVDMPPLSFIRARGRPRGVTHPSVAQ